MKTVRFLGGVFVALLTVTAGAETTNRQHVFSMSCKVTSLNGPLATEAGRAKAISWWRKNHFTALWLESYRHGERVETPRLVEERDAFRAAGFETRGLVTPTMLNDADANGKVPMAVCWSDGKARTRLSAECVRAAEIFETVILDDFLFSSCGEGCARCTADKAKRGLADWGEYRRKLLYEVCEKDILAPVRAAHPKAKFIIKYPCWYRNYARDGYDPERQNDLFGACWIGTETRDANPNPLQACWIMDWMDRLSRGRCGGGWYDGLDSTPEKFVEQAYYTILGGARESLVHCYDYLLADDPGKTPFGEKVRRAGACAKAFEREADRLKKLGDFLVGAERLGFEMGANGVSRHRFRRDGKTYLARLNTTGVSAEGLSPHGFDFAAEASASAYGVWIEAEDFSRPGAWCVDTQFTHTMGSAYLIAPGVGKPVGTASTEIVLSTEGVWTAWVRTKDWLPTHHPGRFALSVDGKRAKGELGASGRTGWVWEEAGAFTLAAGRHALALEDLSGAYARCDAILLTTDRAFCPPDDSAATERLRTRLAPPAETVKGPFDVVVVGGGPAGLCASVAAARTGAKTVLVQDRPVLGGNCSDEIGVRTDGGSCHVPNGRESGLVEEWNLLDPNRRGRWISAAAERLVSGETNLTVLLNERVTGATTNADGSVVAVLARNTRTGAKTLVSGEIFIDATGDGWLGYYAGARYRFGREAQTEFNEPKSHAPERADALTMSGCLCYYKFEMRESPVAFATPAWANVLPVGFDRKVSNLKMPWWLEHPSSLDDIADPETARDELIRYNFAYWGWLKNKSKLAGEAKGAELVSVPFVNGRRESRRLVGDYILTANDLVAGRVFPDAVCHGGWGIDVHDVLGMKRPVGDGWEKHPLAVPLYSIPFRSLYSVNVPNLLMAGRCLSATRLAFGSARVGGTCAAMGQAVGTAAALCCRYGVSPRTLGRDRIGALQQQLLKDDQYVPGVRNEDPLDLARGARVTASSEKGVQSFRRPIWGRGPKGAKTASDGTLLAEGACAAAVIDGVTRIVGTTAHAWVSAEPLPQWISLAFETPKTISEVRLTFDTDLSLPYPGYFPKTLVKDYVLEVRTGGGWKTVAVETNNTRRLRLHRFAPQKVDSIRLTVKATHGSPEARVYEIRSYAESFCR